MIDQFTTFLFFLYTYIVISVTLAVLGSCYLIYQFWRMLYGPRSKVRLTPDDSSEGSGTPSLPW